MNARARVGRGSRFAIGAQVVVTVVLALAALLLVNWLAARPGVRQRWDLTETGQNTLSTATLGVVARLEEPVTIDVFFRGEEGPLVRVGLDAMERTYRLLVLMAQEVGDQLTIRNNDLADRVAFEQRLRELRLTGFENCLIVSSGDRREVLSLRGDLAEFDPGRPRELGYRPARILAFKAEEAIVQGILKVTRGEAPRVYFSTGHGERDLYGIDDESALGALQKELVDDGFETFLWQFEEDGPVPDDCAALAIMGPESAFADEELEAITNYVATGGRLVVSPANGPREFQRSRVRELLAEYGIEISDGLVLRPYVDAVGKVTVGDPVTQVHRIPPSGIARHPITDPLREGGRSVVLPFVRKVSVKPGGQPPQGTSLPILRSGSESWLDLPPIDHLPDMDSEEKGPFDLAVVSAFVPPNAPETAALEVRPESRIVAIGATDAFINYTFGFNADFARNVFNWAVSRDYRVSISPRNPDLRILPIGQTDHLAKVTRVVVWGLPGLCLLLGVLTAWRRAAGGPRSRSRTA